MLVQKRGRTTGVTHGIVTTSGETSSTRGTYYVDYPNLPPVNNPITNLPTTQRQLKNQIQVMIDFPQTVIWAESGDSRSVVVDTNMRIVGLHFAHGSKELGDPITFGIMTPIGVVEQELSISLTSPV